VTRLRAYLNFAGNAEEAFDFYRSVFGGEFSSVARFKDFPMEGVTVPKKDEHKIMHIGLPIGEDEILMASDTLESLGQELVQGNNIYVSVHPTSSEEADRIFNALSEGGDIEMPIAHQAWGDYYGSFKDKFGVMWMVNYSSPREESNDTCFGWGDARIIRSEVFERVLHQGLRPSLMGGRRVRGVATGERRTHDRSALRGEGKERDAGQDHLESRDTGGKGRVRAN
jgi:PhnB protein